MIAGLLIIVGATACLSASAFADDPIETAALPHLVVGTKHSPPFAFRNPDGQWTGISIELWRHLGDEINVEYEFRELPLEEMLAGIETGELDVAVAAISVTADRLQRVEFCHPHFTTGLGIAVRARDPATNWSMVRRIVSTRLLRIAGVILGIVAVCGLLFWIAERKRNEGTFGGGRRQGVGMGLWWSMILLLGHKGVFPVSTFGRVVAACSMVASILLLSLLTGVITSVLTVQQLDTGIEHPSDLRHVRTVTVESSTSADYLRRRRIGFRAVPKAEEALQAVAESRADAAVYDEALLRYLANTEFVESIHVLPVSFNTQEYAIALQSDSTLRKPLNEALLRFRASDSWDELIYRYLGE
ncbi:Cystine-binding periplasmic protein precursor [Maioricimonas rarisocia]|uniref:Cystine-binding periplasmic protein n=1 Tax=Maioricimonas rarisocia TaxID=2528026 RepID=A0A517Z9I5_9PLAN|nr:transporter substrate-binding domain-containing protein [Maioricimonas rarisocia]QDU39080.1 Cystine-binding periplasmic protein precursor [Maioricimonas rarisocia]